MSPSIGAKHAQRLSVVVPKSNVAERNDLGNPAKTASIVKTSSKPVDLASPLGY
jgi:hypothetical protein